MARRTRFPPASLLGLLLLFQGCADTQDPTSTEGQSLARPLVNSFRVAGVPEPSADGGRSIPIEVKPNFMVANGNNNGSKVVLDFEGVVDFTQITNQFVELGVTFSGAAILREGFSLSTPAFPPRSGIGVIFDWPLAFGGVISVNFATQALSAGGYVTGNRVVTFRCFDSEGKLVGSASTPGPNYFGAGTGFPPNLFLGVSSPGIASCTFSDGGNSYTVDDFTFESAISIVATVETPNPGTSFTAAALENIIRVRATVTPPELAGRVVVWRVERHPDHSPDTPLPPALLGTDATFLVHALPHTRWPRDHRAALALGPKQLSYLMTATLQVEGILHESNRVEATQDETDTAREEYIELALTRLPGRGEFSREARCEIVCNNTGDYNVAIINPRFGADVGELEAAWTEMWQLNSLYRNPVHNRFHTEGAAFYSRHQYGCATDLQTFPVPIRTRRDAEEAEDFWNRLARLARRMGFAVEPRAQSGVGHVHIQQQC